MRKLLVWLLPVFFLCPNVYAGTYTAVKVDSPPTIDGDVAEFSSVASIELSNSNGTVGTYRFMWDSTALYIAATVADAELSAIGVNRDDSLWRDDSIELFFDTLNNDGQSRQADDYKFFVNVLNVQADSRGTGGAASFDANFISAVTTVGTVNTGGDVDTGYTLEIAVPWAEWGVTPPEDGTIFGFDFGMNDRGNSDFRTQAFWTNSVGNANNPSGWGKMIFADSDGDTTPPGPPSALVVSVYTGPPAKIDITPTFAWDYTQGETPAETFAIYMSEVSGEYNYGQGNALAVTTYGTWVGNNNELTVPIITVEVGKPYYFTVTARGVSQGQFSESGPSNEVTHIVPAQ